MSDRNAYPLVRCFDCLKEFSGSPQDARVAGWASLESAAGFPALGPDDCGLTSEWWGQCPACRAGQDRALTGVA